jgi:hypothetical protein
MGTVRNGPNAIFPVEATNSNPPPGQNQAGGYIGAVHTF